MIFETVIFDGGMKRFRVLNLMSGTFYCVEYETFDAARKTIVDGEERAGHIVKYVDIRDIYNLMNAIDRGINCYEGPEIEVDYEALAEKSRRTCEMLHEEERRAAEQKVQGGKRKDR